MKDVGVTNEKMPMRPLEHPKIAPKLIDFWPYSIKGSYLEYRKPHGDELTIVIDPWPGGRTG